MAGLNCGMIQKYHRYQEKNEMRQQQLKLEQRRGEPSKKAR